MAWLPTWLQPPSRPEKTLDVDSKQESTSSPTVKNTTSPSDASTHNSISHPETLSTPSPSSPYNMNEEEEYFFRHGPSYAIPMTGSILGFVAGFYTAANRTGLIFMAENAHRRPDTVQGWYFYNKTKNYKVLLGGVKGGVKAGLRVGLWTCAYIAIEQSVEKARNLFSSKNSDLVHSRWNGRWIDGATAGLGIATGASILYRLPGPISRRALFLGTITGASVGALRQLQGELAEAKLQEAQSVET